jgi:hypothetical protein
MEDNLGRGIRREQGEIDNSESKKVQ